MKPSYRFRKAEKLSAEKQIQKLFDLGTSFHSYPFRVVWMKTEEVMAKQSAIGISVPKRKFKNAVDRNRIKRLIREAYRLQKSTLLSFLEEKEIKIVFMVLYTHNEILDFETIERKISAMLLRLQKEVELTR